MNYTDTKSTTHNIIGKDQVITSTGHPVADTVATTVTIATFFNILPSICAIPAAIYFCFKIWETDTVRGWRNLPPLKKNYE